MKYMGGVLFVVQESEERGCEGSEWESGWCLEGVRVFGGGGWVYSWWLEECQLMIFAPLSLSLCSIAGCSVCLLCCAVVWLVIAQSNSPPPPPLLPCWVAGPNRAS